MTKTTVFFIESFGAAFVFWLGLFLCTRSIPARNTRQELTNLWQNPPLMAGSAITLLSFFSSGLRCRRLPKRPNTS